MPEEDFERRISGSGGRLPAMGLFWHNCALVAGLLTCVTSWTALNAGQPDAADAKAKGPSHNVTLAEEPGVMDLLTRAQKARAKAEKDPEAWPECVKTYGEILRKYANTVYLDRWEGPDNTEPAFKNGLYKSTRERVMQDIASLPPGGLAIYRVINDAPARALFMEAQEECDARKMEQVAQEYFPTSWGDDALVWLAETALDRGSARQAVVRLSQALKHPSLSVPRAALLVRLLVAQTQLGDRDGAEKTLEAIEAAAQDPKTGDVRLGPASGPAAVATLRARVEAMPKDGAGKPGTAAAGRSWRTYFGNSAHSQVPPSRQNVGLRKWSVPIQHLLQGPKAESGAAKVADDEGTPVVDPTINHHLTMHEGHFFLCDWQRVVAYPVGNPQAGTVTTGGNARFVFPAGTEPPVRAATDRDRRRQVIINRFGPGMGAGVRHHPHFCTIANERLYFVCGGEPVTMQPNMWPGTEVKQTPNYLVALGRQRSGGSLASGKLVWSLHPEANSPAFESQSKADQDWLKTAFFVSAPTCEAGVLYALASVRAGSQEAWVAAFDGDTGRLLWRTLVCAGSPVQLGGVVQPDLGLPLAVAGGTVYACTNLGATAALDAMSGTIRWIRVYDRLKSMDRMNVRSFRTVSDFWGPNPPIVYENLVIVTPQDSEFLYVYNTETGQRVWEISRNENAAAHKHILGITAGNLVLSGGNLAFYDIKSGRKTGPDEPLPLDRPIRGRGLATENVILLPTESSLLSIGVSVVDGRLRTAALGEHKWTEPDKEAGNVFVAGDVLFTVSHDYVNAYYVWEEMEARLKERIAGHPDDLGAYNELADVYYRVERFEQALSTLETARQAAERTKNDPKAAAALADLHRRRFDVLLAMGNALQKAKTSAAGAYDRFKQALEVARSPSPGQPETLPVIALRAMAENRALNGDPAAAVENYQEIIVRHGDVVYGYSPECAAKARLFARGRIEELRREAPGCYAKTEAAAAAAVQQAGSDAARLEAVLDQYPNADACGAALRALARATVEKDPDRARQHAQRFLSRFPKSPDAPEATFILAVAFERCRMTGAAKDVLQRLAARPELDGALPFVPAGTPAGTPAPTRIAEWAKARLTQPDMQRAPSAAAVSLGNGRLQLAWNGPAGDQSIPLLTSGVAPEAMRRVLLSVDDKSELAAFAAGEEGKELWMPRPKLPVSGPVRQNPNMPFQVRMVAQQPTGFWAGQVLIMASDREVLAYDSREKGKVLWRKDLKMQPQPPQIQVGADRLAIGYATGILQVIDAQTGEELWTQAENAPFFGAPAMGERFVAVATQHPGRVAIFDLETGARRGVIDAPGNVTLPPVARGDRLYFVEGNRLIKAADGATGKLLWQQDAGGAVKALATGSDLLAAVVDGRQVVALDAEGGGARRKWSPVLPLMATVGTVYIDGEDLYVVTNVTQQKPKLIAYSIPKEGKILWDVELSSNPLGALTVSPQTVTTGHLVLTQSTWDPTGDKPAAVVLVDRVTGKLAWAQNLSSDSGARDADGLMAPPFRVQVFDGGVAITEGGRRSVYLVQGTRNLDDAITALAAQAAKDPDDLDAQARLCVKRFEKGERLAAVKDLGAILGHRKLSDERFVPLYAQFARLRHELAKQQKRTLTFVQVADGSKLDASPANWAAVPETVFDGWPDVYLPSDDETSGSIKRSAWNGPADLQVSFRGAFDQQNLHILLAVTDDKHSNDATEGAYCDLGDSVRLVFDCDRDGGMGFRGDDYEIGACLNNAGAVLAWRWVEHGKFLTGNTPLAPAPVVVRAEADKRTVYKFTLPLAQLGLRSEAGRKFGFSFAVHDQDDGAAVNKSMCASPGALRPVVPAVFGEGILQAKQ